MTRTTVTLPEDLLIELMSLVDAKSKTEAVVIAVKDEIDRVRPHGSQLWPGQWNLPPRLTKFAMVTSALASVPGVT